MATIENSMNTETDAARIERLNLAGFSEKRLESLTRAHAAGVSDEVFMQLAKALRLARNSETIELPAHRYEGLSRGRGWARKGKGDNAEWGERTDGGYRVGAGKWSVGATDGFNRKGALDWEVKHVQVGEQTWTIAN